MLWLIYLVALILGIPLTLFCIYGIYIVIQRWKYSHIPTPPMAGMSIMKTDIICLWFFHQPFVIVTGVNNVKDVLIHKQLNKYQPAMDPVASPFGERFMGNGLATVCDYDTWKPRRHLFNPAFHRTYLKDLVPVFNHTCDLLLEKLRQLADGKTEVKMYDQFSKSTLNIIANAGCGLDVDLINNDLHLAHYVPRIMEGIEYLFFHPFYWLNPSAWKFVNETKDTIRKVRKIGRDVILKRRKEIADGKEVEKDLLSFIVKAADKDSSLSIEDLVDEYSTFFLAGHETTGSLLGISLLLIANHPGVEQKLRDEIYKVLGNKKTADVDDLPKLNYLGQVFKETLRMYPIASGSFRIVQEGQVIAGHRMPMDSCVVVSFYVNQRHPDHWTDPDTFNPDRFSDDHKHEPIMFTPFSAGARNCIGQNMAQMEAKVLMARFLQEFEFKLSPGQGIEIIESGTLKPKFGTKGTLVIRDKAC